LCQPNSRIASACFGGRQQSFRSSLLSVRLGGACTRVIVGGPGHHNSIFPERVRIGCRDGAVRQRVEEAVRLASAGEELLWANVAREEPNRLLGRLDEIGLGLDARRNDQVSTARYESTPQIAVEFAITDNAPTGLGEPACLR
jgi:hypothetical protein